ncbi:hypothetical protein CYMTET_23748 [Cymbomonas tetramitiformis]|uniref:Uncharacterized protein n=1 Tax=Cymbomonas tetramitiformis TaxID=36881 RepID=A0AAE0FXK4_9CHLO|nr:hypothetical protein CYMTET_23748 [Cymbomonas tetramitiformis]
MSRRNTKSETGTQKPARRAQLARGGALVGNGAGDPQTSKTKKKLAFAKPKVCCVPYFPHSQNGRVPVLDDNCRVCGGYYHRGCSAGKAYPGECGQCGIWSDDFCLFCAKGKEDGSAPGHSCKNCKRSFHGVCAFGFKQNPDMNWCHRAGCDGVGQFHKYCLPSKYPPGMMKELKSRSQPWTRLGAAGAAGPAAGGQQQAIVEEEQSAGELAADAGAAGAAAGAAAGGQQQAIVEEEQSAGELAADAGAAGAAAGAAAGGQQEAIVEEEQAAGEVAANAVAAGAAAGAAAGGQQEAMVEEEQAAGEVAADAGGQVVAEEQLSVGGDNATLDGLLHDYLSDLSKEESEEEDEAAMQIRKNGEEAATKEIIEGSVSAPCPSEDLQGAAVLIAVAGERSEMEIANDQQGVTAGGAAAISAPSEDLQGAAVPVAVAGERPEMENAEEAQGVASGENTTWPVDGEFGLDVLIEPVDSRLVLNTVPLPQPYWLTALFAEKKFSASCPQRCHAMGPDLPARLTLRNITRGDTAFGRVVVHEKLNTQFWIAGCVEAVAALENGMRELLIAPVENIQHHKKNAEGKFEGELLPVFTPPEPLKRKALSPPPTASTRRSQQLGVPAASPAGESQLPVATPAAEPGDAALHKRLADLKLQLEITKLEEELRQREVTAGGGSSGASVGGSMAAAPIPSEQPQKQQQEQQQPPPQLQEQQQQFQASSAPPHGNEGVGFALQPPAEVRAGTMPAGGNAMFPLNSGCLPGGMLLSQGQQQTLPPQANALFQQFLPALGGRGQGLAEMYFGTHQQMPQDEPTVTLSLREAQLLGQRLMNPAQQARGGRGGRNMNLEEYLFFINQNR